MNEKSLYRYQAEKNRLNQLFQDLKEERNANLYKKNVITDMPRGNAQGSFTERYVDRCEEIEEKIRKCIKRMVKERKLIEDILDIAPYPERIIIRYRVIYAMEWKDIGKTLEMDRTTPSRIFHKYIALLNNAS